MKLKVKQKNTLIVVLFCVLLVGVVFAICSVAFGENEQIRVSSNKFSVGSLSASGKYKESKSSIYTKEAIECLGLKCEISFDATIKYQIFFYDNQDNFLNSTRELTNDYTGTPKLARYCRIVITPNGDSDIKFWEVSKYAKQLSVKVDKNQNFKYENNLFVADNTKTNKSFSADSLIQTSEKTGFGCSKVVDVTNLSKLYVLIPNTDVSNSVTVYYANENFVVQSQKTYQIDSDYTGNDLFEFEIELPISARQIGIVYTLNTNVFVFGE